jgi:hypothetical protein
MTVELVIEAADGDQLLNLTLEPYEPAAALPSDALRSTAALARSLSQSSDPQRLRQLLARVQEAFGPQRLVWSFSLRAGRPTWELYVYNGMTDAPLLPNEIELATGLGWTPGLTAALDARRVDPWSIDIDDTSFEPDATVRAVNAYCNAGANAALSYRIEPDRVTLTNMYRRFLVDETSAINHAAARMIHLAGIHRVDDLRPAEYLELHLASKTAADGIYWVGVPANDALAWCRQADPTGVLASCLEPDLERIRHLRFDVGVDVVAHGDQLVPTKVAIYGTL